MWESEEKPLVKDDSLPSVPHLLYPDIPCDSATFDFPCEISSLNVSTFDHSLETPSVILSLHCGEDTSFSENPFDLSSVVSINAEGKHFGFSSTPLHHSLDHEDADEHHEFSNRGFHDLSTPLIDHDVDLLDVNLSKPLVFDYIYVDEVETPQTVEAHQPALVVMLGPCCPEVNSTSDQKSIEIPEAPHHSPMCIEDQSSSHISFLPPKSRDPVAHALEDSYSMSTLVKRIFSSFFMFSCQSRSKECTFLSSMHSVLQHHGTST